MFNHSLNHISDEDTNRRERCSIAKIKLSVKITSAINAVN